MSSKEIDAVIFGASGFTGKYILREMLKFCDLGDGKSRRVGIAGRSRSKLSEALIWAMGGLEGVIPAAVTIFEADVQDTASLDYMCSKTRLVINCVGPYGLYGEPVVAACVRASIDYLDLAGEPDFMSGIINKYHEQARGRRALIVTSCGFDSVPQELGLLFTSRQLRNQNPDAELAAVDIYNSLLGSKGLSETNFGTYESAVRVIANEAGLKKLFFTLSKPQPRSRPTPQFHGASRGFVHWHEISQTWALKMNFGDSPSPVGMMIDRTLKAVSEDLQSLDSEEDAREPSTADEKKKWAGIKPIQHTEYMCFRSLWGLLGMILFMFVVLILSCFRKGLDLLLEYPEFFSLGYVRKHGPEQNAIDSSTCQVWCEGRGYSRPSKKAKKELDVHVVTSISGPDAGYVITPICIVQAALMILDQRTTLPMGGVLSPGAAFGCSELQDLLIANGIKFDVIKNLVASESSLKCT